MSKTSDSPSIESDPSWKGLIPCVVGGLAMSAALFFLPGWSGAMTLAQSVGAGIAWAFLALTALIGSSLVIAMPVIGFTGAALIFSCACGLFKYRHAPVELRDRLGIGLVIGALSLFVFFIGILERNTSRIIAFADPGLVSESVSAFDAMSVEELSKADRIEMPWRHQKFSQWMENGVVVEPFTSATCRKIIRGYLSSPAASGYLMEVNGQVVTAATPASACPAFDFSTIKLTKLK